VYPARTIFRFIDNSCAQNCLFHGGGSGTAYCLTYVGGRVKSLPTAKFLLGEGSSTRSSRLLHVWRRRELPEENLDYTATDDGRRARARTTKRAVSDDGRSMIRPLFSHKS